MTDPLTSFPWAYNPLNHFSKLSYYKVNFTKSLILGLGIGPTMKWASSEMLPYTCSNAGIPYLGTKLTSSATSLAADNFVLLIAKLDKLSGVGRLASFKMTILSQILYIFCTLHIPIKAKYLHSLSKLLKKYIWKSKRARCSHTLLIKHRSVGGVGLVDIRDYLNAAHLDQLRCWFRGSFEVLWLEIDSLTLVSDLWMLLLADM